MIWGGGDYSIINISMNSVTNHTNSTSKSSDNQDLHTNN